VAGADRITWKAIDRALQDGCRGLPGGSSLARLLVEHRGFRNKADLPELTVEKILAWAEAHQAAHGGWPSGTEGAIPGTAGETWKGIAMALRLGHRGLRRSTTLARLLAAHRRRRPLVLTVAMIEAWAVSHHRATGRWPNILSGRVLDMPDETWKRIDRSLRDGNRGLPGGQSLPIFLESLRAGRTIRS
jgi:hypothetical protein